MAAWSWSIAHLDPNMFRFPARWLILGSITVHVMGLVQCCTVWWGCVSNETVFGTRNEAGGVPGGPPLGRVNCCFNGQDIIIIANVYGVLDGVARAKARKWATSLAIRHFCTTLEVLCPLVLTKRESRNRSLDTPTPRCVNGINSEYVLEKAVLYESQLGY